MNITKIKIRHGCLDVTYNESVATDNGRAENEIVKKCNYLVHQNWHDAFKKLTPHLADLCEIYDYYTFVDLNEKEKQRLYMNELIIGGSEDDEKVKLTGEWVLQREDGKRRLSLESTWQRFGDHKNYQFADELRSSVEAVIEETIAYLNGKCAFRQVEMDFDSDEGVVQIAPKKRGRKKKEPETQTDDDNEFVSARIAPSDCEQDDNELRMPYKDSRELETETEYVIAAAVAI